MLVGIDGRIDTDERCFLKLNNSFYNPALILTNFTLVDPNLHIFSIFPCPFYGIIAYQNFRLAIHG